MLPPTERAPAEPAVAAPSPEPARVRCRKCGLLDVRRLPCPSCGTIPDPAPEPPDDWLARSLAALEREMRDWPQWKREAASQDEHLSLRRAADIGAAPTPEHEPPSAREGEAPVCKHCGQPRAEHSAWLYCPNTRAAETYEPAAPQPVAETVPRPELCRGCVEHTQCAQVPTCWSRRQWYDAGRAAAQAELERLREQLRGQIRTAGAAMQDFERERAKREAAERRVVELEGERGMVEHAHGLDVTNQRLRAEKAESALIDVRADLTAARAALETLRGLARALASAVDQTATSRKRASSTIVTVHSEGWGRVVAARDALRAALGTS